ncbi:hypothetical protein FOCC_FOCC001282 [Frankliniella occidentalis]|nr:hypothetical protein FOCC_FOCC001282 [Frankliniella occidentalis]
MDTPAPRTPCVTDDFSSCLDCPTGMLTDEEPDDFDCQQQPCESLEKPSPTDDSTQYMSCADSSTSMSSRDGIDSSNSGHSSPSLSKSFDMDMSSCEEDSDYEAHYLEEEDDLQPQEQPDVLPEDPDGPPGPEDPEDDPDDPDQHLTDDEDSSDDDTFSFDRAALDAPVRVGRVRTKREVLLMKLANALKDRRTYDSLIRDFKGFNMSIGRPNYLPECKKTLWSLLGRKDAGVTKWGYGPDCLHFLGRYRRLHGPIIQCPTCEEQIPFANVKWFISLSLKKQFENFLALPGVAHLLRYREWRVKGREDAVEDILDGELYQELQRNGVIGQMDFTYSFNSDGFRKFKHQSLHAWGLLVRLNELPPNLRQRNLFLAGIWIDKAEPNMNTFLRPFVHQANSLSQNGVMWRPNDVEVNSKIIPLACCVDAKARAIIMNQHQYNGEWGCYCCNHHGIFLDGSMKYPLLPFQDLPEAEDRTHNSIHAAMLRGYFFEGQKGASEIIHLNHFNMASGNGMDDLHPFYEGVAKFYFDLLVSDVLRRNAAPALRTMNLRMNGVRTPTQMSRKWDTIYNTDKWKGSQWGYFIRYFAVVLSVNNRLPQEHFDHLSMLSYSLFILSQDSILEEEFIRAENYLERFLVYFQNSFGAGNMRFNVHMLKHVVRSRRLLGPAWTISTFNFESWNMVIGALVTAANGASEQIVIRHMMKSYVHAGVCRNDVADEVKNYVNSVLFGCPRKIAEEINRDTVVLGHPSQVLLAEDEVALLTAKGFRNVNRVTVFDRVLVRGIEYRCSTYHPDTKSDNSLVKTWDGAFLTINKIAVFDGEDGRVCGLFVTCHGTDYPIGFAHHVAHFTGVDRPDFVLANVLRVPAMKFEVRESWYVVPMASCREID